MAICLQPHRAESEKHLPIDSSQYSNYQANRYPDDICFEHGRPFLGGREVGTDIDELVLHMALHSQFLVDFRMRNLDHTACCQLGDSDRSIVDLIVPG